MTTVFRCDKGKTECCSPKSALRDLLRFEEVHNIARNDTAFVPDYDAAYPQPVPDLHQPPFPQQPYPQPPYEHPPYEHPPYEPPYEQPYDHSTYEQPPPYEQPPYPPQPPYEPTYEQPPQPSYEQPYAQPPAYEQPSQPPYDQPPYNQQPPFDRRPYLAVQNASIGEERVSSHSAQACSIWATSPPCPDSTQ